MAQGFYLVHVVILHFSVQSTVRNIPTANRSLVVAILFCLSFLVLSYMINELQDKELALDSSARLAALESLDALFIPIATFKLDNL